MAALSFYRKGGEMMDRSEFLNCIARNVNRIRAYELGHDGSGGTCDCIG